MTIMIAEMQIANRRSVTSPTFRDWLPEGHQVSLRQVAWLSNVFQSID